jgi:hypothetical protein
LLLLEISFLAHGEGLTGHKSITLCSCCQTCGVQGRAQECIRLE